MVTRLQNVVQTVQSVAKSPWPNVTAHPQNGCLDVTFDYSDPFVHKFLPKVAKASGNWFENQSLGCRHVYVRNALPDWLRDLKTQNTL